MYVDGFVIPVPTANREAYRKEAEKFWPVLRDFGALEICECWGDDVPDGEVTSFARAVQAKPDETVVFAYVIWPDRETRQAAESRMLSDPRMDDMGMPFDGKRLIVGSFVPIFHAVADAAE